MRTYTTAILVALFSIAFASVTQAAIIQWNAGNSNWNQDANWSGGVAPADPNSAVIDNNATVTVSDAQDCAQLLVGNDWNYDTNASGGFPTGSGILQIDPGASLNVVSGTSIGSDNSSSVPGLYGQVKQYGGTLTVGGWFDVGGVVGGAEGYYNLYGGTLDINTNANIGRRAASTFGVVGSGGAMDVSGSLTIWGNGTLMESFNDGTGVSTINVVGGTTLTNARIKAYVDDTTASFTAGDSWTIIDAAWVIPSALHVDGSTITSIDPVGYDFQINYVGNTVQLTALDSVPEPGTFVLLGLGLLGLLAYAWRKRK